MDYTNHAQICNYNLLCDCDTKLTEKRLSEAESDSMEIAPESPMDALDTYRGLPNFRASK